MRFGERLYHNRLRRHFFQEALAEALGVSSRSILRWEKGQADPQAYVRLWQITVKRENKKNGHQSKETHAKAASRLEKHFPIILQNGEPTLSPLSVSEETFPNS